MHTQSVIIAFCSLLYLPMFAQPDWELTPSDFEFTMTMTGVAIIDCEESTDENDIVAAFINGELRGVQALNVDDQGRKFAYMIIYDNNFSGNQVYFRIYDASQDSVFVAQQSVLFAENGIVGYSDDPFIFNTDYNLAGTFLTQDSIDQYAIAGNIVAEMHTINEIQDTLSMAYEFVADDFGPDNHFFTIHDNLLILDENVNADVKTSYQIHVNSSKSDGCSRNDVFTLHVTGQVITAVDDLGKSDNKDDILILPNPATTYFQFDTEQLIDRVCLYTVDGRILRGNRNLSKSNTVDISDVNPGIYMVGYYVDGIKYVDKLIVN